MANLIPSFVVKRTGRTNLLSPVKCGDSEKDVLETVNRHIITFGQILIHQDIDYFVIILAGANNCILEEHWYNREIHGWKQNTINDIFCYMGSFLVCSSCVSLDNFIYIGLVSMETHSSRSEGDASSRNRRDHHVCLLDKSAIANMNKAPQD